MSQLEKTEFLRILEKYNSGNASEKEIEFLDAYYNSFDLHPDFAKDLTKSELRHFKTELQSSVKDSIHRSQQEKNIKRKRVTLKLVFSAAAAILIIVAGLIYYPREIIDEQVFELAKENDIRPGSNNAILTLSNGKQIRLNDANNGTLAEQEGVQITKTAEGQLVYTVSANSYTSNIIQYNTIETPKGGKYQIRLPDGSNVWLNAASSLTFPSSFVTEKSRIVELKGEAYFEIENDRSRLFIVKTATQQVEVIGTHFNINSYGDEPAAKTTLIEGTVKVSAKNGKDRILKPGQQSVIIGNNIKIDETDAERAVAWKNDEFVFESDDIQYVMRLVSRWYNVEVEYLGPIPESKFGGAVSRFDNVSEVLKSLESTGRVKFKLEGRRILVSR